MQKIYKASLCGLFLIAFGTQSALANSCNLKNNKLTPIGKASFEKQKTFGSKGLYSPICNQKINMGDDNEKDCYIGYRSPPFSTSARNIRLVSSDYSLVKLYYERNNGGGLDMYIGKNGNYYTRADGWFCSSAKKVKIRFK